MQGTANADVAAGRYTTREAARSLGVSEGRIRYMVRSGLLAPARGARGSFLFSFQDLVILRNACELLDQGVPAVRIGRSLDRLKRQLPEHRPLSAVRIRAEGSEILASQGGTAWHPSTGQMHLDFEGGGEPGFVSASRVPARRIHLLDQAERWYQEGCELESSNPGAAVAAYRRALELEPEHADALINLGRLLHEARRLEEAEGCYRRVLQINPASAVAHFNLGVVSEDRGCRESAIEAYRQAVECDPGLKEAHFNLARLYEQVGSTQLALQHLNTYRRLAGE
jgi:tetratricopeptide (TPR) repeat protein